MKDGNMVNRCVMELLIMKIPFWDMSHGRMGTYLGKTQTGDGETENIEYIPINGIFPKTIKRVPKGSLKIIEQVSEEMSRKGVAFLFMGPNGATPLKAK